MLHELLASRFLTHLFPDSLTFWFILLYADQNRSKESTVCSFLKNSLPIRMDCVESFQNRYFFSPVNSFFIFSGTSASLFCLFGIMN